MTCMEEGGQIKELFKQHSAEKAGTGTYRQEVKQMAGKSQIKPERRNRYVKCKGYGRFTLYS